MGSNIPSDQLSQDVPGSTNKLFSFALDPTQWYVIETKVTVEGGIRVTKRQAAQTGVADVSPNLPRNQYTGEYDTFNVLLVPPPAIPPAPPPA